MGSTGVDPPSRRAVRSRGRRIVAVVAILAVGSLATLGAVRLNHQRAVDSATDEVRHDLLGASASIQAGFDRSDEVVASIAEFFMASPGVSATQFARFADPTLARHPEVEALQYEQYLTDPQRAAFEAELRAQGADAGIVEPDPDGGVRPRPPQPEYVAVLYNRPPNANREAFGLDVLARPAVARLVSEIRDSGEEGVTPSVALVQGDGSLYGMNVYRPIYDPNLPLDTAAQRHDAFRGLAVSVVIYGDIVRANASMLDRADWVLSDPASGEDVLMASVHGRTHDQSDAAVAASALAGRPSATESIDIGPRNLQLSAWVRPAVVASYEQPAETLILLLGTALTLGAALLYWRWSKQRRLMQMAEALQVANTRLGESAQRMQALAESDGLTGLPNRESVRRRAEELAAAGRSFLVGLVDLDRFKLVNDSVGHGQGDELLRAVANRLSTAGGEDVLVGRMGGDEFALVVAEPSGGPVDDADVGLAVVERIVGSLDRPFKLGDRTLHVDATVGASRFPDDGEGARDILLSADLAMHAAKESRRGGLVSYDATIAERVARREWLERELRKALDADDGSFTMHFQAKVDLANGDLVGAEALARWTHPEQGPVPPTEFIPVAEETGLILRLGDFALRESCELIRRSSDLGLAMGSVSVNVSGQQLRDDDFLARIRAHLDRVEVPATRLMLEVTESEAMDEDEPGSSVDQLHALADLGVGLSIDDFGTGYSSMARISTLPVRELKIDRAFISTLTSGRANADITRAIISLAHQLGLMVVAEGVETEDQLSWLRSEGCDQAQGWLFGRAVPASTFIARAIPRRGDPDRANMHRPPLPQP